VTLTRDASLILIGTSVWTVLTSSILYEHFLFLTALFIQSFFSFYLFFAHRGLGGVEGAHFRAERVVTGELVEGKNILHVRVRGWLEDADRRLYVALVDRTPYGARLLEGRQVCEGVVGGGLVVEARYKLIADPAVHLIRFEGIRLRVFDQLKLCFVEREVGGDEEVALSGGEQLIGASYARLWVSAYKPPTGFGFKGLVGFDDEFTGVKTYEPSDRTRDIHWVRTAQRVDDELVAKRYVKRSDVEVHVVVDCSPSINAGEGGALVIDIINMVRRLCVSAAEEGNAVQFWLLNPRLRPEERVSPMRTPTKSHLEEYVARIFPAEGSLDRGIAETFMGSLKRGSLAFFIVNPPSGNSGLIGEMVDACREAGACVVLCMPDMATYVSPASGYLERLLILDGAYKVWWLSRYGEGVEVVLLQRGFVIDLAREVMRRRGFGGTAG